METHITISADDRKAINSFARRVKGLAIYSHCQVAIRTDDTEGGNHTEHANLAFFGIRRPGGVFQTDLADFGPRLADLRQVENHPSGFVVLDFYTYGRDRVGGDLQLDTNVQAVWKDGQLVALSEGREIEWLVEPDVCRSCGWSLNGGEIDICTACESEAAEAPATGGNPFVRIHVEHDPSQQQVVRLCADHLRMAESCGMVDQRDVPAIQSECFCNTCHFCD